MADKKDKELTEEELKEIDDSFILGFDVLNFDS